MNRRFESHIFWGAHSPLSTLGGAALIIMASGRFAFALICTGALVWVYGFSALIYANTRAFMPRQGRMVVLLFLTSFLSGIFVLLAGLLNPLLIFGTGFFIVLIPPCCLGSGFFEASETEYPIEIFSRALLEAVVLGAIILGFALIREPLGIGTLSFPGGSQGIVELFDNRDLKTFIPARILSVSAGGLLLLGYGTALFRYFRDRNGPNGEEDDNK